MSMTMMMQRMYLANCFVVSVVPTPSTIRIPVLLWVLVLVQLSVLVVSVFVSMSV